MHTVRDQKKKRDFRVLAWKVFRCGNYHIKKLCFTFNKKKIKFY